MKNVFATFLLLAVFSLVSCGGGAAGVEVNAEMKEFMGMLKGSHTDVEAALAKFAANDDVKDNDMSMYDLKTPKATAAEGDSVTMEAAAGMTTRTYKLCWADGKINKIEDLGMK